MCFVLYGIIIDFMYSVSESKCRKFDLHVGTPFAREVRACA